MARLALLLGLAVLTLTMAAVIVLDLITHPRDVWAALCFAAGSLAGAAQERYRDRRR